MKKFPFFLIALLLSAVGVWAYAPEPVEKANEKVAHAFLRSYGNVEDIRWYLSEGSYTAVFRHEDIIQHVRYNLEGRFLGSVRYYQERHLPPTILQKLNRKHPGKTVFGVTEIMTGPNVEYYVKMFDHEKWYTIKIGPSGIMSVGKKYKRAPGEKM